MLPPLPVLPRRIKHGEIILLSSGLSFRTLPPKTLTGYPVAEWPSRWAPTYHPPRESFDWLNLIGAMLVIGLGAFVLFMGFRFFGWL